MTKLSLALILILVSACGKAPEFKTKLEGKNAEPLVGKTDSEILSLKYNNKIFMNCEVRVKKGQTIDLSAPPTDSFSWELPGDNTVMRVLNFRLGNIDTVVVVRLNEKMKFVDSNTVIDEKQNEYYMEHSPVVSMSYRRDSKTILVNGTIHDTFKFRNVKLFENVETRVFTVTNEDNDRHDVTEDFRCILKTSINPDYQYQWKKVR